MIFFENKLLLQSDVVFDSESNGRNFSSLASPGGEKKVIFIFLQNDVTSFIFILMLELKNQPPTQNLRKTAKMTKKNF